MRKWIHGAVRSAFMTWAANAFEFSQACGILAQTTTRIKNGCLYKVWASWLDFSFDCWQQRVVLERLTKTNIVASLCKVFVIWEESVLEQKCLQQSFLDQIASRMHLYAEARTLWRWVERAGVLYRLPVAATRVVQKWSHLAFSMDAWKERVHGLCHQPAAHNKVVSCLKIIAVSRMFFKWRTYCCVQRTLHGVNAWALKKFRCQKSASVMQTWKGMLVELMQQRVLLARLAMCSRNLTVFAAFAHWQEISLQEKMRRNLMGKLARRIHYIISTSTLTIWIDALHERQRLKMVARVVMNRLTRHSACMALVNWQDYHVCKSKNKGLLMKITKCLMHRALITLIVTWRQFLAAAQERKTLKEQIKRQRFIWSQKIVQKTFYVLRDVPLKSLQDRSLILARLRLRLKTRSILHFTLHTWYLICRIDQLRLRNKLNFRNRLLRRLLHITLVHWSRVATENSLAISYTGDALQLAYIKLHEAREVWSNATCEMDELVETVAIAEDQQSRMQIQISKCITRIIRVYCLYSLRHVFDRWLYSVSIKVQRDPYCKSTGMMLRWHTRRQMAIFGHFSRQVEIQRRVRLLHGDTAARFTGMMLHWHIRRQMAAFVNFRRQIEFRKRARLLHSDTAARKHVQQLFLCTQIWKDFAIRQRRARLLHGDTAAHIHEQHLFWCTHTWKEFTLRHGFHRRIQEIANRKDQQIGSFDRLLSAQDCVTLMKNTLMQWNSTLTSTAVHRYDVLTSKIILRGLQSKLFETWYHNVKHIEDLAVLEIRLECCIDAKRFRSIREVFVKWIRFTSYTAQQQEMQKRAYQDLEEQKTQGSMQETMLAIRNRELTDVTQTQQYVHQQLERSLETCTQLRSQHILKQRARMRRVQDQRCLVWAYDVWCCLEQFHTLEYACGVILNVTAPEPTLGPERVAIAFSVNIEEAYTDHLDNEMSFIQQLKIDIECAVNAPRGCVQVLYRHIGSSTLKMIFSRKDIDTGFEYCNSYVGANPAEKLKQCVEDSASSIHSMPAARLIASVEIHGEVSYGVAKEVSRGMRAFEESRTKMKQTQQMLHERSRALQTDRDQLGTIVQRTNARCLVLASQILTQLQLRHLRKAFHFFISCTVVARHFNILCTHTSEQQRQRFLCTSFQRLKIWKRARQVLQNSLLRMSLKRTFDTVAAFFGKWQTTVSMTAVEANQPVVVAMKFDLDYDEIIEDGLKRQAFDEQLTNDMSISLGVPASTFFVLAYHKGSIIVQVAFTPEPPGDLNADRSLKRSPTQLAQEMLSQVCSRESVFRRLGTGSSVQSATVQCVVSADLMQGLIEAQTVAGAQSSRRRILEEVSKQNVEELITRNSCEDSMGIFLDGLHYSFAAVELLLSTIEVLVRTKQICGASLSTLTKPMMKAKADLVDLKRYETPSEQVARALQHVYEQHELRPSSGVVELGSVQRTNRFEKTQIALEKAQMTYALAEATTEKAEADLLEIRVGHHRVLNQGLEDARVIADALVKTDDANDDAVTNVKQVTLVAKALQAVQQECAMYKLENKGMKKACQENSAQVLQLRVTISQLTEGNSQRGSFLDRSVREIRAQMLQSDQPMVVQDAVLCAELSFLHLELAEARSKRETLDATYSDEIDALSSGLPDAIALARSFEVQSQENEVCSKACCIAVEVVEGTLQHERYVLSEHTEALSAELDATHQCCVQGTCEAQDLRTALQNARFQRTQQVSALQVQLAEAQAKLRGFETNLSEQIQSMSQDLADAIAMARNRANALQEQAALAFATALETVEGTMHNQTILLSAQTEATAGELEAGTRQPESLRRALTTVRKERNQQVSEPGLELEEAQDQIKCLETRYSDQVHALNSGLEEAICIAHRKYAEVQEKMAIKEAFVLAAEAVHRTLQRQQSFISAEKDVLSAEVVAGTRHAENLQRALIQVATERNQKVSTLQVDLEESNSTIRRMEECEAENEGYVADQESQLLRLSAENDALSENVGVRTRDISALEYALDVANTKIQEFEMQYNAKMHTLSTDLEDAVDAILPTRTCKEESHEKMTQVSHAVLQLQLGEAREACQQMHRRETQYRKQVLALSAGLENALMLKHTDQYELQFKSQTQEVVASSVLQQELEEAHYTIHQLEIKCSDQVLKLSAGLENLIDLSRTRDEELREKIAEKDACLVDIQSRTTIREEAVQGHLSCLSAEKDALSEQVAVGLCDVNTLKIALHRVTTAQDQQRSVMQGELEKAHDTIRQLEIKCRAQVLKLSAGLENAIALTCTREVESREKIAAKEADLKESREKIAEHQAHVDAAAEVLEIFTQRQIALVTSEKDVLLDQVATGLKLAEVLKVGLQQVTTDRDQQVSAMKGELEKAYNSIRQLEIKCSSQVLKLSAELEITIDLSRTRDEELREKIVEKEACLVNMQLLATIREAGVQGHLSCISAEKDALSEQVAVGLRRVEDSKIALHQVNMARDEQVSALQLELGTKIRELESTYKGHMRILIAKDSDQESSLHHRLSLMCAEKNSLMAQLDAGKKHADHLQNALNQLTDETNQNLSALRSKLVEANTKVGELETNHSRAICALNVDLENIISEHTRAREEESNANETEKSAFVLAVRAVKSLQLEKGILSAQKDSLSAVMVAGTREVDDLHKELLRVSSERNQFVAQLEIMSRDVLVQRAEASRVDTELSVALLDLQAAQSQSTVLDHKVADMAVQVDELHEQLAAVKQVAREETVVVDTLRRNLEFVQKEIEVARQDVLGKGNALVAEGCKVRDLHVKLHALTMDLDAARVESQLSLQELCAMVDCIAEKDKQLSAGQRMQAVFHSEMDVLRKNLVLMQAEKTTIMNELSICSIYSRELQIKVQDLKDTEESQVAETRNLQDTLQVKMSLLQFDLDAAHMGEADVAVRVAHADARNVELYRELDATRKTSQMFHSELECTRAQVKHGHERMALLQHGMEVQRIEAARACSELEMLAHSMVEGEMKVTVNQKLLEESWRRHMGCEMEALNTGLSDALSLAKSRSNESQHLQLNNQIMLQQNVGLCTEVEDAAQRIRGHVSELLTLRLHSETLSNKVFTLEADLTVSVQERNDVETQATALRRSLQDASVKSTEMAEKLLSAQYTTRQLHYEKETLAADLAITETTLAGVRQGLQFTADSSAENAAKLLEQQRQSRQLAQDVVGLQDALQTSSLVCAELHKTLGEMRLEKNNLVHHVTRQRAEAHNIELEIVDLQTGLYLDLQGLEREKEASSQRVLQMQTRLTQCLEHVAQEKIQVARDLLSRDEHIVHLSTELSDVRESLGVCQQEVEKNLRLLLTQQLQTESDAKKAQDMDSEFELLSEGLADALVVARSSSDETHELMRQRQTLLLEKTLLEAKLEESKQLAAKAQIEVSMQVADLARDVTEYQRRLDEARVEEAAVRRGNEKLQEENEALKASLHAMACEIDVHTQQASTAQKCATDLVRDLDVYQERLQSARAESHLVRTENDDLLIHVKEQMEEFQHRESVLQTDIHRLQQDLNEYVTAEEELKKFVAQQTMEAAAAETESLQVQAEKENMLADVKTQMEHCLQREATLHNDIDGLRQALNEHGAHVEVLQREVTQKDADARSAWQSVLTLQRDVRDLRARTDSLVREKHSKDHEIDNIKKERNFLACELGVSVRGDTVTSIGSNPFSDIGDENAQPPNTSWMMTGSRIEILSAQVARRKAAETMQRQKYVEMQTQVSGLLETLQDSQKDVRSARAEISTMVIDKDYLQAQIASAQEQAETRVAVLDAQLQVMQTQKDHMHVMLREQRNELADTLAAHQDFFALQPSIEFLEGGMKEALRVVHDWQREVERVRQSDRMSVLTASQASIHCQLLKEDFLKLQARYNTMEAMYEESQVQLEMLNAGVKVISENHAEMEQALHSEVSSGNLAYAEMRETLVRKEMETIHSSQVAVLQTRALAKWRAQVRHIKVCRGVAVRRAQSKKLQAGAFVWRSWKMFYLQRRKMIDRHDYWKEKGALAEILRRQDGQRFVRTCFARFAQLCRRQKLLIEVKYVRQRKVLRHHTHRWRAQLACRKGLGFVPRPARLLQFQSLQNVELQMAMMVGKHLNQCLLDVSRARRMQLLATVVESWNVLNKTSRVEHAVTHRVVERAHWNQGRRCMERSLVHWRKLGTAPVTAATCATTNASVCVWPRFATRMLGQHDTSTQLVDVMHAHRRCTRLQHALAARAARYGNHSLVSDAFLAWALVAKASVHELQRAEQNASHLTTKAKVSQLESVGAALQADLLQRQHLLDSWTKCHDLSRRNVTRHSNETLVLNCFVAVRCLVRWRRRYSTLVDRMCDAHCEHLLTDLLQQWVRFTVASQLQTSKEHLDLERCSVNTLAQWHATARSEQDSSRVSLMQLLNDMTVSLSHLSTEYQDQVRELHTHVDAELRGVDTNMTCLLDSRKTLLETWLARRHVRLVKAGRFDSWAHTSNKRGALKRRAVERRLFDAWRQVRFSECQAFCLFVCGQLCESVHMCYWSTCLF